MSAPKSRRVLVVDDSEDSATLLAELLRDEGHEARVAHDGPSALAVARDFRPAVCVLDLDLPLMDGYEVALRLRREVLVDMSVKLIAVTGFGQASYRRRSIDAGFDAHIVKPVAIDHLLLLISDNTAPVAG